MHILPHIHYKNSDESYILYSNYAQIKSQLNNIRFLDQ